MDPADTRHALSAQDPYLVIMSSDCSSAPQHGRSNAVYDRPHAVDGGGARAIALSHRRCRSRSCVPEPQRLLSVTLRLSRETLSVKVFCQVSRFFASMSAGVFPVLVHVFL